MLPTLYSRTSTGKVQQWDIEVDGNKFRTISGQTDGAKVTSEWTVCDGKNVGRANETTGAQQALLEAQAKHKKQLDKGYKEDISKIDEVDFIEPMLAKEYDKVVTGKKGISFPVYAQPKLDGMRCVVHSGGMFSRNGKPIVSAPHIFEAVKHLFITLPGLVLDGELYADKFKDDFNAIISLAKKAKPSDLELEESEEHLQYWVYDLVDRCNLQATFSMRNRALTRIVEGLKNPSIVLVETIQVHDETHLNGLLDLWLNAGMEGQMVRLDVPYEFKRTKSLLKRKEWDEGEFKVLDVVEGVGNRSGMAGAVTVEMPDGRACSSNIIGGNDFCRRLLKDKASVIGKQATVKYHNYTPDGFLRFPHMKAIRDYE